MKRCFIQQLLFGIILFHAYDGKAQRVKFNRLDFGETVLNGAITAISQDHKGYIWFSVSAVGGLFRYDGMQVTRYKNDPLNPKSLASNWVECMYIDSNDVIWLGTFGSGIDRFDPATGIFTHLRHNQKDPQSLGNDSVIVIMKDRKGVMWVGDYMGLEKFDPATSTFTHYPPIKNDPATLSNNEVRVIYEDRQGSLWVGTGSPWSGQGPGAGGLNRFDRATGKFTRYLHDPKDSTSLANNKVRVIFQDSRGTMWVGTAGDGLHTFDPEKGTFRRYPFDPSHPDKLSRPPLNKNFDADQISFITEDQFGEIWIGTVGSGINRFNLKTKQLIYYDALDTLHDLKVSDCWSTFTSRDGIVWIGTFSGSIYKTKLHHTVLPHVVLNHPVYSFHEESENIMWLGTDSGLVRKNRQTGKTDWFLKDTLKPGSLSNNLVLSIKTAAGGFWVATHGGGLDRYDGISGIFTNYRHNSKDSNSLVNDLIHSIVKDKNENLWIGTDGGLDFLDVKTGKFLHFKNNSTLQKSLAFEGVQSLYLDNKNRIWVGTGTGLNKIDPGTGSVQAYLGHDAISCIYEDRNGLLLVGSASGLYKFNESLNDFSSIINPSTGKEFPMLYAITEDENKNTWFSSAVGLIKFNEKLNESFTYGENAGIRPDMLLFKSAFTSKTGKLIFGDAYGYFEFSPGDLSKNAKPPGIILTEFRLNNKIIEGGKNSPLKEELWQTEEINLTYDQNVFSFGLGVIDYDNPERNQLLYKLENYDNDWRLAGSEKKGSYFNVPPGRYILKVKGCNSSGLWAQKNIAININPPWWRTWWAYTLFALLVVGSIWGFIYYRSKSLIKDKRVLEHKVNLRTQEVMKQKEEIAAQRDNLEQTLNELQNTQLQLVQREKMASLGELTAGIAHEIQNPLNFVNNFSEVNAELIEELRQQIDRGNFSDVKIIANEIKENEQKIVHHGKRADAIVKGMLLHSRSSTAQKELTDINALADEYLRLSYHGFRAKDNAFKVTLETDFDESLQNVRVIQQDIGRVLLNLYNNAFYSIAEKKKQNADSYQPTVFVSTRKTGNAIEIHVKDNGNGIPQKLLDKIFQPFYTTKPTGRGTGLGLSLSYDIIKAHQGVINVVTTEGESAEFIIQLPSLVS